jgi:hypothetical protein
VRRELDGLGTLLETNPLFFAVTFSILYWLGTLGAAVNQKLWLDEIISSYITSLPAIKDVWLALLHTVDGNPPLYYLIARLFVPFLNPDIAIRLPAIIGFWVAALCLFDFVRRRTSALAGAIATLAFANSGALPWAWEGRPYAVVLGLMGLAIFIWQRCIEPGRSRAWLAALALVMAALVSTHYYSLLLLGPFFLAEIAHALRDKRADWLLLLSVSLGTGVILLYLPLLHGLHENIAVNAASANYFAAPSFMDMLRTYQALALPLVMPALVSAVVTFVAAQARMADLTPGRNRFQVQEMAVILGMVALPASAYLGAILVTHTFVLRYVLGGALGIAMLAGVVVHQVLGSNRALTTAVCVVLTLNFIYVLLPRAMSPDPTYEDVLASVGEAPGDAPVAIAEGLLFPSVWHYASPELRHRLFYLTDLETAKQTTDTTNENIMILMKGFAPESIQNVDEFLRTGSRFFVFYNGPSGNSILEALGRRSCAITLVKKNGDRFLFQSDCAQP